MSKTKLIISGVVVMATIGIVFIFLNPFNSSNQTTKVESTEQPTEIAPPTLNDTKEYDPIIDKDYAQKMLLLHQQIQEIAATVRSRSTNNTIVELANQLTNESGSSQDQIKQLFITVADDYMDLPQYPQVDGHDMYPSHSGMATALEVAELSTLSGAELDTAYLKLAAVQYEGMLELAETTGKRIQFGELKTIRITSIDIAHANIQNIKEIKKSYENS